MSHDREPVSVNHPDSSSADKARLAAIESLRQLLADSSIPDAVREAMGPEFTELARALDKLEQDQVHVAVFGRVSVGKSALLNALLGREEFKVGVLHGTTEVAEQEPWRSSSSGSWHLIDTPGIDEMDGDARERLAFTTTMRVDLVLFVVEGDLTDTELAALQRLHQPTRPLILALNKSDRYTVLERATLLAKLRERTQGWVAPDDVIAVSARPRERIVIRVDSAGKEVEERQARAPDIAELLARMQNLLQKEGRTLSALNAGMIASDIADRIGERITEVRKDVAAKLVHTYSLSKGVAVGLNPLPVADLLTAAGIDVALVVHLSRVYGLPLTKTEAGELIGTICAQIAALMGAIWGVHLVASALKSVSAGLSTALTAGAQGALAYYATTLTGRAAEKYLQNGKSWGELGPKRVVSRILKDLDRDSLLRQARAEILKRLSA